MVKSSLLLKVKKIKGFGLSTPNYFFVLWFLLSRYACDLNCSSVSRSLNFNYSGVFNDLNYLESLGYISFVKSSRSKSILLTDKGLSLALEIDFLFNKILGLKDDLY